MTRIGLTSTETTATVSEENDDRRPKLANPTVRRSHTKIIETNYRRDNEHRNGRHTNIGGLTSP